MKWNILLLMLLTVAVQQAKAQAKDAKGSPQAVAPEDRPVDMDDPTFVPMVRVGKVLLGRDSVQYVELNNIYVYPQPTFQNEEQRQAYNRLVYNVKKVLPIAKEVNRIIVETYDYIQTLPNKKAKDKHMWRKASRRSIRRA